MTTTKKDKDLPPGWPADFPQNLEEFKKTLKSDGLVKYLEERGIFLRFDEKNDKVTIMRKKV